jgi:hypothetical protein
MALAPVTVLVNHLSGDLILRSLSEDSLAFARPVFPLPVEGPMVGLSWAFPAAAHRPVTRLAVGVGTGVGHLPGGSLSSAPLSSATACRNFLA